jgi:hypothetical protein
MVMSELTLDQIEQRLRELPDAEREAWLDHICKRFGVTKPEPIIVKQTEYVPLPQPYPVYPQPMYPDFPGTSPMWYTTTNTRDDLCAQ